MRLCRNNESIDWLPSSPLIKASPIVNLKRLRKTTITTTIWIFHKLTGKGKVILIWLKKIRKSTNVIVLALSYTSRTIKEGKVHDARPNIVLNHKSRAPKVAMFFRSRPGRPSCLQINSKRNKNFCVQWSLTRKMPSSWHTIIVELTWIWTTISLSKMSLLFKKNIKTVLKCNQTPIYRSEVVCSCRRSGLTGPRNCIVLCKRLIRSSRSRPFKDALVAVRASPSRMIWFSLILSSS